MSTNFVNYFLKTFLCFVDPASLYILVNKANLVHNLRAEINILRKFVHQVGLIYKICNRSFEVFNEESLF
jgi:hypothetical protein